MKLNVVFMGTPHFAVPALEALQKHSDQFVITGVYTQPDKPVGRGLEVQASPVKKKAIEFGLPVFQPEKLSQPGEFERLQTLQPDIIVVVAYGQILRKNVLTLPRLGCVNIHSSLLPRWRGAAPIHWALLAGDQETGVTTMHLVEKLDAGDMLLQAKTPISEQDTASTLHDRLAIMGSELIVPTLQGLHQGTLKGQTQDESQVTYAHKLTKEMESLDPNQDAETLARKVRALNPWPGTSIALKTGERVKIKAAKAHRSISGPQGKVFERAGMVLLGTVDGSLELMQLQLEGKKAVDASAFLNGLKGRGQQLPLELA